MFTVPEEQYKPPYSVTDDIIALVAMIGEQVGTVTAKTKSSVTPQLRRENHIRSIHSSLVIENNPLSLEQMTDIINGKRVLGAKREIREVKNAYAVYDRLIEFNPYDINHLLIAHELLMSGLTNEAGCFRYGSVGVFAGNRLIHTAPLASVVPELIYNLVDWARRSNAHPLIKSCVFHYAFEFIHPFADGNGRMGRLWQTLLLAKWKPLFAWLPVETIVCERQREYYDALAQSDKAADCTVFVEFMLGAIHDALARLLHTTQVSEQVTVQVEHLLDALGEQTLSAVQLMACLGLRHRQSFAKLYLQPAIRLGLIEMTVPDKPNSRLQKYRKKEKTL
jgi:Fic family protein